MRSVIERSNKVTEPREAALACIQKGLIGGDFHPGHFELGKKRLLGWIEVDSLLEGFLIRNEIVLIARISGRRFPRTNASTAWSRKASTLLIVVRVKDDNK